MNECNCQVGVRPLLSHRVAHLHPVEKLLGPPDVVALASYERYCPGVFGISLLFPRQDSIIGSRVFPRGDSLCLPRSVIIPGCFSCGDLGCSPLANAHFDHAEVGRRVSMEGYTADLNGARAYNTLSYGVRVLVCCDFTVGGPQVMQVVGRHPRIGSFASQGAINVVIDSSERSCVPDLERNFSSESKAAESNRAGS